MTMGFCKRDLWRCRGIQVQDSAARKERMRFHADVKESERGLGKLCVFAKKRFLSIGRVSQSVNVLVYLSRS